MIKKNANLYIIRAPEDDKKKGIEKVFEEIMTENFPNLKKETNIWYRKNIRTYLK